jgi:hypothetical protein
MVWHQDHSEVRVGAAPQGMATMRNVALLRLAGWTNIARAAEKMSGRPARSSPFPALEAADQKRAGHDPATLTITLLAGWVTGSAEG